MSSIKLENVCLDYVIKTGSQSLKKTAMQLLKSFSKKDKINFPRNTSFRALNNINLEIKKGDRIGLLGRNGAGKSTLLKVLAKVYKPDCGIIDIQGKISNLFDLNLGMNLEATGYENIFNLSILRGLTKKHILNSINDIENFTELNSFLNNPVRTYSSGMLMKLAFAVATSIPSDILLIDEIIGVGDDHFLHKATKRLENKIENTPILVLTSHSNEIIERFCNKTLVLKNGEIQFLGNTADGINFYKNTYQY